MLLLCWSGKVRSAVLRHFVIPMNCRLVRSDASTGGSLSGLPVSTWFLVAFASQVTLISFAAPLKVGEKHKPAHYLTDVYRKSKQSTLLLRTRKAFTPARVLGPILNPSYGVTVAIAKDVIGSEIHFTFINSCISLLLRYGNLSFRIVRAGL